MDILLTKGPTPVFISCKTGVPNTQALNELDVLRERYGGYWAKGVLATMSRLSHVNPSVYRRAADMGIYVLQQEDITQEGLAESFSALHRVGRDGRMNIKKFQKNLALLPQM